MARLIVIEGPDRGKEFPLESTEVDSHIVGRDPRHTIALADTTVSREHFRIDRLRSGFRLVDLGSRNRTFLNGEPIRDNLLRHGDVIAVGDSELRFEDEQAAADPLPDVHSTIVKEIPARGGDSIVRIIDSLRDDPVLRGERIRRAVDSLRQLFMLSREILQTTSLEGLYTRLLEILLPALDADYAVVLDRTDSGWVPRSVCASPGLRRSRFAGEDEPTRLAPLETAGRTAASRDRTTLMSESVVRRVADEKNAVLFSVAEHGAAGDGSPAGSVVAARISSAVAAPILGPGANGEAEVRGVLYSDRRGERPPLAEAELHLLSAAAEQAGEVLRHLESQARLRCANETLIRSIVDSKRIVGDSEPIREVHRFIHKAAPTSLTVLIRGETGTGKELVAAAIHYHSARQGKPFVTINCAAIPENLVESELFGHEKGAFTSATGRKKGRFELADSGTVFLDELGELAPACQAKLLRLLEEQRFERVGGTQTIEVDVRIIAATNKDLAGAVAAGQFREDLFYRLNVLGVELPPLRDRPEDVPILAEHFLADIGVPKERRSLSQEVTEKLCRYTWPGNVRQLRNVIESAMVLGEGSRIRVQDLVLPSDAPSAGGSGTWRWQPESLDAMQKRHIQRVLEHTGGNKKKAAEILGIERCTLYSKLKSYGITPK